MPGCPLAIWNLEEFQEIGNALANFLHADPKLLSREDRRMGRIMVEFDLNYGLPAEIDIDWHGNVFQQRLDYLGVTFRCLVCKEMGHLRHQCYGVKKKESAVGEGVVELKTTVKNTVNEDWSEILQPPTVDNDTNFGDLSAALDDKN